jgi:hypothetical protein
MAEYVAKRDRNRCPTHPGELLREEVIPATGKTRSEIAALLGTGSVSCSAMGLGSGRECRARENRHADAARPAMLVHAALAS